MDLSDKKPVITAVKMLKSKGAAGGRLCMKGTILKAGPGQDITHEVAFHFVAARHAENLTAVADKLKKDKAGNWILPEDKGASAQAGGARQGGE